MSICIAQFHETVTPLMCSTIITCRKAVKKDSHPAVSLTMAVLPS